MSGVGAYVAVTFDFRDAFAGLSALEHVHLGKAFQALKAPLRADQKEHATSKVGPESTWPPRASSTTESYAHRKKHPRKLMGKLPTAVSYAASGGGISATSRATWSEAHQTGAVVGHGARLPARPFLWISDKMMAIAENRIGDVAIAAFGGG